VRRACRGVVGGRSGSRAASNQQFARRSRVGGMRQTAAARGRGGERGQLGRRRAFLRGRLGDELRRFQDRLGAVLDWPDCGERLKWPHVSLWPAGFQHAQEHARLACQSDAPLTSNKAARWPLLRRPSVYVVLRARMGAQQYDAMRYNTIQYDTIPSTTEEAAG
jgi:hypothetical protein